MQEINFGNGKSKVQLSEVGREKWGGEVEDTDAFIPHLRQCEVNGFCLRGWIKKHLRVLLKSCSQPQEEREKN